MEHSVHFVCIHLKLWTICEEEKKRLFVWNFQVLREGDQSQQPRRGDICKINSVGKLENGTIVEELHSYTLQVGDVEVVQGIDMVLPLMRVGELAQVAAEARFAYGSIGLKNETDNDKSIPPNATVSSNRNCNRAIGLSSIRSLHSRSLTKLSSSNAMKKRT